MATSEVRFAPQSLFKPTTGGYLTVHLPGETIRCRVDRVIGSDSVIVEIDSVPMAKTHLFRKGDKVGALRRVEHGRDLWEALPDRDFLSGRSPNVPPELPVAEPSPEPKKRRSKVA